MRKMRCSLCKTIIHLEIVDNGGDGSGPRFPPNSRMHLLSSTAGLYTSQKLGVGLSPSALKPSHLKPYHNPQPTQSSKIKIFVGIYDIIIDFFTVYLLLLSTIFLLLAVRAFLLAGKFILSNQ